MARLGELDFPDRVSAWLPVWAAQLVFAVFAVALGAILRLFIEAIAPGAGAFALTFPAILVATLFARWQSGVLTLALITLAAWYAVLPVRMSFELANESDAPRIVVNILAGLTVVGVGEVFRRAVRLAVSERDARIAERELLLRELDHRVRNNFAAVASLVDMQRRRTHDEATRNALSEVLGRVESIARAHNALHRGSRDFSSVDIRPYLEELSEALATALFLRGSIRLSFSGDSAVVDRDRAISIGLLVNELVTNSAKHAFVGRDHGRIEIDFVATDTGYRLTVADNGSGIAETPGSDSIGLRLMNAFVADANGTLTCKSDGEGTRFVVELAA